MWCTRTSWRPSTRSTTVCWARWVCWARAAAALHLCRLLLRAPGSKHRAPPPSPPALAPAPAAAGVNQWDSAAPPKYVNNTHLSARVGRLNPDWNQDASGERGQPGGWWLRAREGCALALPGPNRCDARWHPSCADEATMAQFRAAMQLTGAEFAEAVSYYAKARFCCCCVCHCATPTCPATEPRWDNAAPLLNPSAPCPSPPCSHGCRRGRTSRRRWTSGCRCTPQVRPGRRR